MATDRTGESRIETTADGVAFAIMGSPTARPAPLLLVFAVGMTETLERADFNKIGHLLLEHGYVCVGLPVPGHGEDVRPDEGAGDLPTWQTRILAGESLMDPVAARAGAVLDHLIATGVADPARLAVAGTSRGGFTALHVAAREPRFRHVVAFAPSTDMRFVREFDSVRQDPRIGAVAIKHQAAKLCDRSIWMCIGNNDQRVSTDSALHFSRCVVAAADARGLPANLVFYISATPGHSIHATAHEEAAAWLLAATEREAIGGALP